MWDQQSWALAGVQEVLAHVTDCHFPKASLQESVR